MEAFEAKCLPLRKEDLDPSVYMEALIDATARLEVYKTKLASSKLDQNWFLPTLQQREAWASSLMEGTQATLDGVLVDQVNPSEKDKNMSEVRNYVRAAEEGYLYLQKHPFSVDFIKRLHKILMSGNVRRNKSTIPGEIRTEQNYLGRGKLISYVPPLAQNVDSLLENFVEYFNNTEDSVRPLVRAAIMHAQFETIHPFMDGNGRVGRILIPLFLYKHNQISLPCFFIILEFFKTNTRQQIRIKVEDDSILELVTSLNGEKSISEIASEQNLDPDELRLLLDYLRSKGILDNVDPKEDFFQYEKYRRVIHFLSEYSTSHEHLLQMWKNITTSTVLIIGLGAVGTWVACNLAETGVGSLILMDGDVVDITNLHRQYGFSENDVGRYKTDVLEERIHKYSNRTHVTSVRKYLESKIIRTGASLWEPGSDYFLFPQYEREDFPDGCGIQPGRYLLPRQHLAAVGAGSPTMTQSLFFCKFRTSPM